MSKIQKIKKLARDPLGVAKTRLLYRSAKKTISELVVNKKTIKLHVGCGPVYKKGWINLDNNSENNITKLDLNWDMRRPLPFPNESVDFIFNEHFLEHLTVEEGKRAIRDMMRVLKPGGVLRIAMPDLATTVWKYSNVPLEQDATIKRFRMDFIKTRAERLNVEFRYWGHQWLYDWEELERRIIESGYNNIKKCKIGKSEHKELQDAETRAESTLIAEISK